MRQADPETGTVAVNGLGKQYGRTWVVRDLSFTLEPGAMLGLVGANGGGKTTTLRMLAGLVRPDDGAGHVFGHAIGTTSASLRPTIGYMSQRLSLYPELSVAENLAFRAAVLGLNQSDAIAQSADRYELAGVLATRFDRLSGGWARRAQFAAVTLGNPALLLLDEPTAGLDVATRRAIWTWLGEFAAAGHIVIVSAAAGLIETTQAGREMINRLRRAEFDRRFPGLLDAVLANNSA